MLKLDNNEVNKRVTMWMTLPPVTANADAGESALLVVVRDTTGLAALIIEPAADLTAAVNMIVAEMSSGRTDVLNVRGREVRKVENTRARNRSA